MMGLRIPKAHKAILEAGVREHTSDVDLRYIIIGFGLAAFIFDLMISEFVSRNTGDANEKFFTIVGICTFILIAYLYVLAKLCRFFPRGARWVIFYSGFIALAGYSLLICFYPALMAAGILMALYLSTVSFVSVRQIYKYHRNLKGSAKENHE